MPLRPAALVAPTSATRPLQLDMDWISAVIRVFSSGERRACQEVFGRGGGDRSTECWRAVFIVSPPRGLAVYTQNASSVTNPDPYGRAQPMDPTLTIP